MGLEVSANEGEKQMYFFFVISYVCDVLDGKDMSFTKYGFASSRLSVICMATAYGIRSLRHGQFYSLKGAMQVINRCASFM